MQGGGDRRVSPVRSDEFVACTGYTDCDFVAWHKSLPPGEECRFQEAVVAPEPKK